MDTSAQQRGFRFWPLVVSLFITLSIGGVAALFTVPQIPGWYAHLHKPGFNPPDAVFGPVWNTLYVMIAVAAYLVWQRRSESATYTRARNIYLLQLLLNFSWSIVFFGLHQILLSVVIIGLLFVSIIINILYFGRISKPAAWLLVPYLLWVSFAGMLNVSIYLLNR